MKCFESCLTVSYSHFISRYHSFPLPSCHLQKLLFHFIAPTLLLFGFYTLLLSSNLLLSPKIWRNKVNGGRHEGDWERDKEVGEREKEVREKEIKRDREGGRKREGEKKEKIRYNATFITHSTIIHFSVLVFDKANCRGERIGIVQVGFHRNENILFVNRREKLLFMIIFHNILFGWLDVCKSSTSYTSITHLINFILVECACVWLDCLHFQ